MLPAVVAELTNLKSGLVLVTGPTGSGKSTTMACLINLINEKRRGNIITLEDPIEFVHSNKNCVVSQREIGLHAAAFGPALRSIMRQDPDVVMVGEMRDLETIASVVTVAETGHLVLATLHSNDAAHAIDRMIDVFPERQQQQIRIQLAGVLRAVVAQTLLPKYQGRGRVAVREIMIVNSAISNLIRTAKSHEIYSAIEMGAREGMVSMSRALGELAAKGLIEQQVANTHQAGMHTQSGKSRQNFGGSSAAA
jgi:twitching motility protein PilT